MEKCQAVEERGLFMVGLFTIFLLLDKSEEVWYKNL